MEVEGRRATVVRHVGRERRCKAKREDGRAERVRMRRRSWMGRAGMARRRSMIAVKRLAAVSRAVTMAAGEAEMGVPPKTTQSAIAA